MEDQNNNKIQIIGMERETLASDLNISLGLQPFRARQLMGWLYRYRHRTFEDMTDISKSVREQLSTRYQIFRPLEETLAKSEDGTKKFLFKMKDGERVETVLIRQDKRNTLCLSSQVGCSLACRFCRTAQMGLKRNLEPHEIVGQLLAVQDYLENDPESAFSNIVFMGMGEPFLNVKNVSTAIKVLNDNLGLDFSRRKITVSTAGVVPGIEEFAKSGAQANLAVSLNATTNAVRSQIMPINKLYPIELLLQSLRNYPLGRRQRITIEYVVIGGVNDSVQDLERLPKLLRGIPVKVNLIPFNPHSGLDYQPPRREILDKWQNELNAQRIQATIRWSRGQDINAACGQLAAKAKKMQ
jgi:23S rRNA (adenine2503-C2)-methyltransferase